MHKRRFLISRMMLFILMATLVSGCVDLSFLAPKDPVTITFWTFGDTAYFEGLIDEFTKENSYITVDFITGFSPFRSNLEEVDVFLATQNQLQFLRETDFPMSLNEMISEDNDFDLNDFYRGGVDALSVEGQRWGVPLGADITVMLYNKRLFDERNVPYPEIGWTWNDFLEKSLALSDPDRGQFGFAYQEVGGFSVAETMIMMYQWGGALFDDLQAPTRMTINEPRNVMAMQFYADLLHKHHVSPRYGERPSPYPTAGIEGEKYTMWVGSISDEYDFETGVAPLPQAEYAYTMGTIIGLYISNEASSPEACWEWATFLSQKAIPGLLPMRKSLAESDEVLQSMGEDVVKTGLASLPNLISFSLDFDSQLGSTWGMAMQAYSSAVSKIRAGEPVQATLDEAQKKSGF